MKTYFTDLDNITNELYQLEQLGKIKSNIFDGLEKVGTQFLDGVNGATAYDVIYELMRVLPQLNALNHFQQESIMKIQRDIDTR